VERLKKPCSPGPVSRNETQTQTRKTSRSRIFL